MNFKIRVFFIILFMVTVGIHTFGFKFYWFYIPIGGFKLTEGLITFLLLLFQSLASGKFLQVNWLDKVLLPFLLLMIYTLIQIFRAVLFQDLSFSDVFIKFPLFICLFFIIPFLYQINYRYEIEYLFKFVLGIAILGSVIALIQFFVPSLITEDYRSFDGVTRVGNEAMIFVGFGNIYSLSALFHESRKGRLFNFIVLVLTSITIILSLSRALIMAVVISDIILTFVYFRSTNQKRSFILKIFSLFLFGILSVFILLFILNYDIFVVFNRFMEGYTEYTSGQLEHSSVGFRTEMSYIKINGVLESSPLLGYGFNFFLDKNIRRGIDGYYDIYFRHDTLNGDSTIPNIMILYGILGILLFSAILIVIFRESYRLYYRTKNSFYKTVLLSFLSIPFYLFIISFGTSLFLNMNLIFIVTVAVFLYKIKIFILN